MATTEKQKSSTAKQTMEVLMEMSKILNTGLDMETLATVVRLCESGANPEALAVVYSELKRESAAIKVINEKRAMIARARSNSSKQNESGGGSTSRQQIG